MKRDADEGVEGMDRVTDADARLTAPEEPEGSGRHPTVGAPRVRTQAVGSPGRVYTTPRLEYYGKLSEITQFGGSTVVDSGSNSLGNMG